jgi:hypothetical protein
LKRLIVFAVLLAASFLFGSWSDGSAAPPAPAVVRADYCLKKPARVTRALQPERVVRVVRGPNARRPVCGGGFQVVSVIGPVDGRCFWTFYDPYSSPRVWSHWDYCP